MIETRHLKNVVIFFKAILSFVLSRKILNISILCLRIDANFFLLCHVLPPSSKTTQVDI